MLQFLVHLINLLSIFLRCNGFTEIQKAVGQSSSRLPNSDHELFFGTSLEQVWLSLEFLLSELAVVSCCIISTFHHMSQLDGEMVHCCCIERRWLFRMIFFQISGHPKLNIFTFPIYFNCQMTVEWSMLSSLATSHVLIRGWASMMVLNWSVSTFDGQPLYSSSSGLLFLL